MNSARSLERYELGCFTDTGFLHGGGLAASPEFIGEMHLVADRTMRPFVAAISVPERLVSHWPRAAFENQPNGVSVIV